MRIISGKYKGKKIEGYDILGTRPTMDRIKESVFGIIQNELKDAVCLDLFAGSGSLGLEAVSNGCKVCYFVDHNKQAIKILKSSIDSLDDHNCITFNMEYDEALKYFKKQNIKFDIIFLDPPYKYNLINSSLELIKKLNLLNDNALIICEYEIEQLNDNLFKLIKEKKYGSKYIKIYKNYCE